MVLSIFAKPINIMLKQHIRECLYRRLEILRHLKQTNFDLG